MTRGEAEVTGKRGLKMVTAWFKNGNEKFYFDSFGVQPPLELIDYLKPDIFYNTEEI